MDIENSYNQLNSLIKFQKMYNLSANDPVFLQISRAIQLRASQVSLNFHHNPTLYRNVIVQSKMNQK